MYQKPVRRRENKPEAFSNSGLSRALELSPHRTEHDRPIFRGQLNRLRSRVRVAFLNRVIRLLQACLRMVQFELRKLKTAAHTGRSG